MEIYNLVHLLLVILGLYEGVHGLYDGSDDNYRYVIETTKQYTWDEAKAKCESTNMKLAEIKTRADFDSLKKIIDAAAIADVKPEDCSKAIHPDECEQDILCKRYNFWVGGKRITPPNGETTNAFRWEGSKEDVDQSAFIWGREQPNNRYGIQNCFDLVFKLAKKVLRMYDDTCSDKNGYICQTKK